MTSGRKTSAKSQKTRVAVVKLSIQFSYGDFYDSGQAS